MRAKLTLKRKIRQSIICLMLAVLMLVSLVPNIAGIAFAEGDTASVVQFADSITSTNVTGTTQNVLYNCDDSATAPSGYYELEGNEFELDTLDNDALAQWVNALKTAYYGDDVDYYESIEGMETVNTGSRAGAVKAENKALTNQIVPFNAVSDGTLEDVYSGTYYYINSYGYINSEKKEAFLSATADSEVLVSEERFIWKVVEYTKTVSISDVEVPQYMIIQASDETKALSISADGDISVTEIANENGDYTPTEDQLFVFLLGESRKVDSVSDVSILKFGRSSDALTKTVTLDGKIAYSGLSFSNHKNNWYFQAVNIPEMDFPEISYTWASSNPEIAEISDTGRVRIHSDGEVKFTCTAYAGAGLTVKVNDTLPMTYSASVTYNFNGYEINDGSPLTDTDDTDNFPAEGEPGSVMIEKSASDTTDYDRNGVAKVKLDVTSIAGNEPIDVVLVVDVSRSMVDFYEYDALFCEGERTEIYVSGTDKLERVVYSDTGSRDIKYYVPDGYMDINADPKKPYDTYNDTAVPVYVFNEDPAAEKEIAYYCRYDSVKGKYELLEKTTIDGEITASDIVLKSDSDIKKIAPDGHYGVDNAASDEYIMNYDKIDAARESSVTFVKTLLTASPNSRVALVQFANDDPKGGGVYYEVNSRVVQPFTNDMNLLISKIENQAGADDNRYAKAGMGGDYYRYDPTSYEFDELENEVAESGMTVSTLGGTNYGLAFERAEQAIAEDPGTPNNRRILVFMTDGEPNTLNLANGNDDSIFRTENENNNITKMRVDGKVKDTASWTYFALRRQLQAKLRIEELGFEIISVGFDLDSDGTGYFGVYESDDKYTVDQNFFNTNLAEEIEYTGSDSSELLGLVRKKVVENIATFDSGYYSVEKSTDGDNPNYGALNAAYEDIAESIMYTTKDAVVTDVIGEDFELRLLPYNNNGTESNPQIVITRNDVEIKTDASGKKVTADNLETLSVIETYTFIGESLEDGITVEHTYIDSTGVRKTETLEEKITSEEYTIEGYYFTYKNASKTFTWNIGDVVSTHFSLSYDAYLTGSDPAYEHAMGRVSVEWQDSGKNVNFTDTRKDIDTNESASLAYTNYLGNECELTYERPKLDWETTEVTVTKVWNDDDDSRKVRPDSISVQLAATANGVETNVYSSVTLNKDNSWSHTWNDLPKYSDGYEITYSVKESEVDCYATEITQSGTDFTVTNKLVTYDVTVKYEDIDGNKLADDDKPYDDLLVEGSPYDIVAQGSKLSKITKNGVTYTFYEVKDNSDDESSEFINKDVVVTYVYVECKQPTIQKRIDGSLTENAVEITTPVSTADYIINYTITITNPNSYEIKNVQCSDTLPEGLEFVANGSDSRVSAGTDKRTLTWTVDSIEGNNGTAQVVVKAKITNTAKAAYDNYAVVTSASFNPDNDENITTVEYRDDPETPEDESVKSNVVHTDILMPEITKAVDKTLAAVGQTVEYTIVVKNNSSVPLYNLTVSDTIPDGMAFVADEEIASAGIIINYTNGKPDGVAGNASVSVSGRDVTAHIPALGRFDTATITLNVTIADASKLTYVNRAYIESGHLAPVPEGTTPPDSDISRTPSNEVKTKIEAEPYITKEVDKSAARIGDILTYTLIVTNNTADNLYMVKVTDTLPKGLELENVGNGGVYNEETNSITWTIDTIEPGEARVSFAAKITSDADMTVENTGILVDGYTDTDNNGKKQHHEYNKDDDADTYIIKNPAIHKTVDKPLTYVGDNIVYTLTVTNSNAVFDLHNIAVTDTLPQGLEYVSATDGVNHEDGVLSINIAELSAGDDIEFRVTAKIKDGSYADYRNTAYITEAVADSDRDGDADSADRKLEYPNGSNHSETTITDVHYDLVIEYRADSKDGDRLKDDYKSEDNIRNSEYIVTDLIPETIVSENGTVWVKKEITSDSNSTEGIFDNDKKIVVIYERYDSLYSLKKYVSTDGVTWQDDEVTVAPGTKIYFKIVIENLCGHEVENLSLGDVLKMNSTEVGKPDAWANIIDAFKTENDTILPVDGWESAPMEYTVPETATGEDVFMNNATVYNSDTDIPPISDNAAVKVYRNDSLEITKTAQLDENERGDKVAMQGQQVAFVLRVENTGNTPLTNVLVIDDTYNVIVKSSDTDITVPAGEVITTIPSLAPGEAESVTVYFTVPETAVDGADFDNFATAKTVDTNGNDVLKDRDNDIIMVDRVEPILSIIKKVNGSDKITAKPGETVYFDITVVNSGNADAENVFISDKMLMGDTGLETEWEGWTVSVPAGGSVVVANQLEWTVPVGTPSDTDFTNVAILYNSEEDCDSGKDPIGEDSAEVTVEADYAIEITKTANLSEVNPGDKITYEIFVTNKSNTALTEISVTDMLDGRWGELPTRTESGKNVTVTENSDNTLSIDTLDAFDVLSLTFVYTVPTDYTEDTIINTVETEADTPDGEISDDASASTKVHINSLDIIKEAQCEEIYAGEKILYYITVRNTGDSALENVVITEALDVTVLKEYVESADGEVSETDFTADDISATDVSATDIVIGYVEKLEPGECKILYVEYTVPKDVEVGDEIWNTVKATADGGHEDSASDEVIVIEYVEHDYKLSISKDTSAELAEKGDNITYIITVTNSGKDDLTNVTVTDSLDVIYGGTEYKAGTVLTTFDLLKSGESKMLNVSYAVPANYSGKEIVNTASADSNETDKVEATETVQIRKPEIKLTKTVNSQNVTAGEKVYYKLIVTNTGNCTLTDVLVQDTSVGYSFTIDRIAPGEVWESADGALSYTFAGGAAAGTSFENNASVIHAEVKGSASTMSTVYVSGPSYTAPNTGDTTEKADSAAMATIAISFAVLISLGVLMIYKRRKTEA